MEYVRGTILWKQQRLDEALALARSSADSFARLREHARWINAKLLEGSVLADSHAPSAALDVFVALSSEPELKRDAASRARIENNLASVYLQLGSLGSASEHFVVALQLMESLRWTVEAARVRWNMGAVALASGDAVEAARRLALAKTELEAHHMLGDAALAALDLAEALLLLGKRDDAQRLATDAFEHARAAGMLPAALTAVAFLRECAQFGRLTPRIVRHVREFLHRLDAAPALAFELPPDT